MDISPPFNSSAAENENVDYRGFSLQDVCWGYRAIFREAIDELYRTGHLGSERRAVTDKFFELLRISDRSGMDHVVKRFLDALRYGPRWLLDLPVVFAEVVDLGRELAEERIAKGVKYFDGLVNGNFGDSPQKVRELVRHMHRLRRQAGTDLALALMEGYPYLLSRMDLHELDLYIESGVEIYKRNPASGCRFMQGMLRTSETYIGNITREVRLEDCSKHLSRLTRAFVGKEVEIDNLGQLDSDDLIERGSSVICCSQGVYMPARVTKNELCSQNREYYLVATMIGIAMLTLKSFPCVHGYAGYDTAASIFPEEDIVNLNLFIVLEYVRVLRYMRHEWPGVNGPLARLLQDEMNERQPADEASALLTALLGDAGKGGTSAINACNALLASEPVSFMELVNGLDRQFSACILQEYPGIGAQPIRPFSFIPDFLFPLAISQSPSRNGVTDLRDQGEIKPSDDVNEADRGEEASSQNQSITSAAEGGKEENKGEEKEVVARGYVYDEWNQADADYLRNYCVVKEKAMSEGRQAAVPEDIFEEARRVSRTFERIKPEENIREKYLAEGDVINADLLLKYLVEKQKRPSPEINFYEKPAISRRDPAVLILLDCSGSTGEQREEKRTIDLETHATVVLGEALATLSDRFAACGFNSNGPQSVHFYVFKDFDEVWNRKTARIMRGVQPANSTRIGTAVRHAGWRLSQQPNKQKLIILITDGRPQDQAYDPSSLYAQHDVRLACQENETKGICTFGISTTENSATDMQLMFGKRYVLLRHIKHLPEILPRLYSRLAF